MFRVIVECFYAFNVSLSLGSLLRNDGNETFDEILLKQISFPTQCIVDCWTEKTDEILPRESSEIKSYAQSFIIFLVHSFVKVG